MIDDGGHDRDVLRALEPTELAPGVSHYRGKVREVLTRRDEMVIVATDRVSAFDRVLGVVPRKGEVLNRISEFWFRATADVCPNHFRRVLTPRSMLVTACRVYPVEVVVRGYLTGSAWRDYAAGRRVSGVTVPPGMRENQEFPTPIITPSTKVDGGHDVPISCTDIVANGIVPADDWAAIERSAYALFARGQEIARDNGLILVDTKYEFGHDGEKIVVVDEMHTPDSSRFWYASTYVERFAAGERPDELDKEYLRRTLMESGYTGDGEPPEIPAAVISELSAKYITAFETITGKKLPDSALDAEAEKKKILSYVNEGS
ncbi:MAG: phosphoribosylaminoimidazolesuccinocarboxamide synthase [Spirochaetaceae bacterium]|nr:MAG: phosphoribosylaminoimidazolesuccinocarboxamide synthase [Spirochaetaceae bacterium]